MSYARSPREVCSTTIGTKTIESLLLLSSRRESTEFCRVANGAERGVCSNERNRSRRGTRGCPAAFSFGGKDGRNGFIRSAGCNHAAACGRDRGWLPRPVQHTGARDRVGKAHPGFRNDCGRI